MTALECILSIFFLAIPFNLDWQAIEATGETRGLFTKAVFLDFLVITIARLL